MNSLCMCKPMYSISSFMLEWPHIKEKKPNMLNNIILYLLNNLVYTLAAKTINALLLLI